jgi:hypothetical protein
MGIAIKMIKCKPGVQVVEGLDHAGRVETGCAVVKVAAISEIIKKSNFKLTYYYIMIPMITISIIMIMVAL